VYLNEFAHTSAPMDMTATDEFKSLLESAADLGIPHNPDVRYVSRQTVVRGLRFHFLEWGEQDAPPVLLLHGGNQSAHSWDLVSLHLADRYRVLAMDQRGHGDSEWARDLEYTVEAMSADALAFLDELHIETPIVFGHSMGGHVTLQMVLSRPVEVRGLVLVDTGPELSAKGIEVVRNFVTHSVEFDDLDEFLDMVARYDRFRSREHIARTVKYNMLRRSDGKYSSKVDHRRVLSGSAPTMRLADFVDLRHPVLLVRGAESDVLEQAAAERFVATMSNARLVTVPATGHNVHSGNTPGFLEAIRPFLSSLD
jgi:pimeloyl-ACP methyl ester carboxylesterase